MRGIQREDGAPLASTLSTTGSPSRAEARSAGGACSHACGRLLALLLAVPGLFTAAPGLVVAPTALLLGGLGLFAPAPAAADVLVSNLGQTTDDNFSSANSPRTRFGTIQPWISVLGLDYANLAQQFTTGSNTSGYTLNSVEIKLSRQNANRRIAVVELWSSTNSGTPNAKLFDLTGPTTQPDGENVLTFTAPANTTLSANTSYFVVFYRGPSRGSGLLNLSGTLASVTASASEDSGGLTGWSIANTLRYDYFHDAGLSWYSDADRAFQIRVNGILSGAPAAPTNLSVDTSVAGQLGLTWTAPSGTLTGYDVHYTSAASGTVVDNAAATGSDPATAWVAVTRSGTTASQTISSLSNGADYRVRVRAKSSVGNGAWAFETGRLASTNADLDNLIVRVSASASGTFTNLNFGGFTTATTAYTATVPNSITRVKLAPAVTDYVNATVEVGKQGETLKEVPEGSFSAAIALDVGENTLIVKVTAEDGNNQDYIVTVTRAATPLRPVVSAGNGELNLSWSDPGTNPAGYDVQYTSAPSSGAGAVGDDAAVTTGEASAGWVDGSHTGTTTSHTITGLNNGTTYRVRVRATFSGNSNGDWEVVRGTPSDASLSVTATPACGSVVTGADLSVKPLVRLQVAPVTGVETEIELRLVDAQGNPISTTSSRPEGWQRTLSVRPIAYTPLGADTTFARFQTWTGFAGFQFRLQDNPSVTAECIWQLDHSGGVTPTDTTTTTTTTTPPRNPPTGGGGNTGGGGGRPRDLRPSFGSASVPDQSYTEGTEITPLELPAATGGNGRLFYALSPVLPEGLTLNRRVRRLSGTPTTPQAAREYTWTATDGDGDATRLTFTVTVAPDLRPSFDNVSVPDQSYTEGTAITPLELPAATGGNGPLTYALTPSLPNGLTLNDVTRRLSGNPISPQAAALYTWTATDGDGDEATLTFTIAIAVDPHRQRVREAARRALAEMARRAMSGALDTIGARFGAVGGSGLSLAGQPVSLESVASVADGIGMAVWNNQSLAFGELLGESAFSLRLAASGEAGDGGVNLEEEGPLWSVWGRGDLASFAGGREEETHYDGWLRSGWLGIDARSGRWVAGMALSHEQGQADYGATMAAAGDRPLQGRLETSLTALYPYGRWQLTDGMELQGVVGVGWGEAHHTPADDPRETGTLSMRMASLGVGRPFPT